jgi:BON domain
MSIDRWLQDQVLAALQRESGVDAAHIGVSVLDGVVMLQGIVPTFRQKWLAERAARRLSSVRAIANDLEVAMSRNRTGATMRFKTLAALALALSLPSTAAAQPRKGGCCAKERHDHANAAEEFPPLPSVAPHASATAPLYDAGQEGVISGVIYSVMRHPGMDVQLTVGVGERTVEVLVAPMEWLDAKRAVFRTGERIAILGSRYDIGTGEALIARELFTTDQAIVVRDRDGRPLWN